MKVSKYAIGGSLAISAGLMVGSMAMQEEAVAPVVIDPAPIVVVEPSPEPEVIATSTKEDEEIAKRIMDGECIAARKTEAGWECIKEITQHELIEEDTRLPCAPAIAAGIVYDPSKCKP